MIFRIFVINNCNNLSLSVIRNHLNISIII
nr:MAG TPA: hypothetical protein [Caudoviricetes sp.]